MKELFDLSNILADLLSGLVDKIDQKLNKKCQIIYLSGIYNHNRLKKEVTNNIISNLKPLFFIISLYFLKIIYLLE